jgi:uncharacterized protein YicC (UPF0701 family)
MKRRTLSLLAAAVLAGPLLAYAAQDEVQRQLTQRTLEAKRKLESAQAAQGAQRNALLQEHLDLMNQMTKQMNAARPGANATPQQMREWIDEHLKLMDQMMSQMMDGQRMMMGPMKDRQHMMKSGK